MNDILEEELVEESAEQAESLPLLPGHELKKLRKQLNLGRTEVAENMHMTVTYIRALEHDEYHKLPGQTFVKGYFKMYAEYLKADVDEVLLRYEQHKQFLAESEQTEATGVRARKNHDQNLRWSMIAGVIIILILGFGWWYA